MINNGNDTCLTGKGYTSERHTQILISLLKANGIKKIVASPGATNVCFVGSLQSDPYFEIYSSVDERSAAFIAVGLAAESGESVVLSCTGSTASRNYIPGLTEAFYRKLPVLAITSTQYLGRVGHYYGQVIDRSIQLADVLNESITIDTINSLEDEWQCTVNVNKAMIALRKDGGGPVHINLVTTYSRDFSCKKLPEVRQIRHIDKESEMPSLDEYKTISILVGVHNKWSDELQIEVDKFCKQYHAVVVANHASNYRGKYGYNPGLLNGCSQYISSIPNADLTIYIGSVSRYSTGMAEKSLWRVCEDGIIRDIDRRLTHVFKMDELEFFRHYTKRGNHVTRVEYAKLWQKEYNEIIGKVPDLPFSNVWIAHEMGKNLPMNSVLHLAGSNTARSWNYFQIPSSVECYSNDGTMGIDGQVSALIGESLADPDKIHIGVVGDLTFFYDMNSIGNRHIRSNFRLLVVNNGKGAEFKIYNHPAYEFGDRGNYFMAAAGHYGNQSKSLIKHYAEDLGFEYMSASSKEEFKEAVKRFITPKHADKPMIFEVFTDTDDENAAIYAMNHIVVNNMGRIKKLAKKVIKSIAGETGVSKVRDVLHK